MIVLHDLESKIINMKIINEIKEVAMTPDECVKYYEETGKDKFYSLVDEDLDIVFWGYIEKGRKPYFHSADCEYQDILPEDLEWFPF